MKKIFLLTIFMMATLIYAYAQNVKITGTLTDRDTKEGVIMATIQLLKSDSTYIKGVLSDENGKFTITAPSEGSFILKITSIGYETLTKKLKISGRKPISLGNIIFKTDAIMLAEATVIGHAAKVTIKEDTFVYNSSAYKTPEGSVVEELIKRLPGSKVDEDGKITMNGKEVTKILIDGKEFMVGDTKTAIKNLPTSIIDKVKTYDEKSDLAKVTGIDDGEEQTVLDFSIKKGMNKGVFGNADLSAGTQSRYAGRIMGSLFKDNTKVMLLGNANNIADRGFPSSGGQKGLNSSKMLGVNFNYNKDKKLAIDGNIRWNHSNGDIRTEQSVENFVSQTGSFSNSSSHNLSRSDSWDARMRLEWKPDSMTNVMFRPNLSYSTSDGKSSSMSASFNEDPYLSVSDPLSDESIAQLAEDGLVVNSRNNNSITYNEKKTAGATIMLNRKLNNKGRNATLRANISYSENDNKNLSISNVHLYQIKDIFGKDSTYQTNRFNLTPTKSSSYMLQATYSEPIFKAMFLQFSYKFTYNYNKSDRSTYDFSNLGEYFFDGIVPEYRGWGNYLSILNEPINYYIDDELSRYSEYKNYIHELKLMLRIIREKYRFNAGIMVQPQQTRFIQEYQGVNTDTTRNVVNVTPTLDFRYRFSKVSNLRINYRGSTSQPSMTDLLDITDDSDPLNITKGNPGLKPSFTNRLSLFYNTYIQKYQRSIMANLNYSNTRNSISNMVTYDATTGGRITKPENINGNWDLAGGFMFNTAVDSAGNWNVNTFTDVRYNNYVGYLVPDNNSSSVKNTTRTMRLGEKLSGSFRNDWLEVSLDGSLNYTHTRNLLQKQNNLDTWQFSYGGFVNVYLPWGTSVATDIHQNSRRGYNDSSMNTNELIWSAQISQNFFKRSPVTVSLQFYDILHNQSNFSRIINAMQRSDTQYNSINSYAMLHVICRINAFGNKKAGQMERRKGMERRRTPRW